MMVGRVLDFWQNLHVSCLAAPERYLLKSGLILSAVVSCMPLSFCAFDSTRARFLVGMKLPFISGVQFTECVCNFVSSTRLNDWVSKYLTVVVLA